MNFGHLQLYSFDGLECFTNECISFHFLLLGVVLDKNCLLTYLFLVAEKHANHY